MPRIFVLAKSYPNTTMHQKVIALFLNLLYCLLRGKEDMGIFLQLFYFTSFSPGFKIVQIFRVELHQLGRYNIDMSMVTGL